MTGPNPSGVRGHTGDLSGSDLLDALSRLGCSGTLVLIQPAGSMLLLLDGGRLQSSVRLGRFGSLDEISQAFHFERHPSSPLPQLGSTYPGSNLAVLRALPAFGPGESFAPGLGDLRVLIPALRKRSFTGSLSASHQTEYGLALLTEGRIRAAGYERDGFLLEGNNALRAIYRYSLDADRSPLQLRTLDPLMVRALVGLAHKRYQHGGSSSDYSGIQAGEEGYTFFQQGQPVLLVRAELLGAGRRYALGPLEDDFLLPDDPPGWEEQHYILTLRGRDALNPMTDLAMQFSSDFGSSGRRILDALGSGLSIEETAARLRLQLEELKPWLNRLEAEGLIRLQH